MQTSLGEIDLEDWVIQNTERVNDLREKAVVNCTDCSRERKKNWDKKAKLRTFEVGQLVLIRKAGLCEKLAQSWVGTILGGHNLGWAQSWVGTILGGHNPGWAQSWVGTILGGHNPGWAQSWVGTILGGHNPGWAQSWVGTILGGHNPGWAQSWVGTILGGHNPGWAQSWVGTILGGHNPGWAQSWVGTILGGHNPGWAQSWVRPHPIVRVNSSLSYQVDTGNGRKQIVHVQCLKRYVEREPPTVVKRVTTVTPDTLEDSMDSSYAKLKVTGQVDIASRESDVQ